MKQKLTNKRVILILGFLACLTTYNFIRVYHAHNVEYSKNNYSRRENLDKYLSTLIGKDIQKFEVINALNNISATINLSNNNIIILLSNNACNPCQITEMEIINNLYNQINEKMNVWVIHVGSNIDELFYIKKICKLNENIKLYYMRPNIIKHIYNAEKYPVVFFVKDNIINKVHKPIYGNPIYSKKFYLSILGNEDQ